MSILKSNFDFSSEAIEAYKNKLIAEMKSAGATQEDFEMFDDALLKDIVVTAMSNKREPRDLAWALLQ